MIFIIGTLLSFCLFIIYDTNQIKDKYLLPVYFFKVGLLLLTISTIGLAVKAGWPTNNPPHLLALAGAVIFLMLLVYSLFFALPARETYATGKSPDQLCRTGMYALCRHPAALWLSGFYLCYWLYFGGRLLLCQFICCSVANFLYIFLQDKYFFPRLFKEYWQYQEDTPFLLPNLASIRRAVYGK